MTSGANLKNICISI